MSAPALPAVSSRPPGDLAIWFVIFAERLIFGIFFLGYGFTRTHNVALAFVKTHWVAHHFMGLRQASWPWRAAMAAWQLAVAVGLGIAYLNPVSP